MSLVTGALCWLKLFPPAQWLAAYRAGWLRSDIIAGVTLAAYAIPVSLAYAALAGLPPQIGVYGYMLGGVGYALLGSSRQLAVGPTSAISLMIAASVGALAAGDAVRYAQIASLAAFAVAVLCLIAWIFRLSMLVRLSHREYKGLYQLGRMWLYVSRGTGFWGPPLRFGIPAEITLITLRRAG